jgi:hypothetical protein
MLFLKRVAMDCKDSAEFVPRNGENQESNRTKWKKLVNHSMKYARCTFKNTEFVQKNARDVQLIKIYAITIYQLGWNAGYIMFAKNVHMSMVRQLEIGG